MRKIVITMIFVAGCFFSTGVFAKNISVADFNEQVIVDYYNALNKGATKLKIAGSQVIAKGAYLDYYGYRTDLLESVNKMQAAFPKHHTEILNIIAEGDQVFVRTQTVAVQKGPLLGIQPTNKTITIVTSNVFHFNKKHQIVLLTQIWNEMNVMRQLGFIVLN